MLKHKKINKKGFVSEGDKALSYLILLLPLIFGITMMSYYFAGEMKNMVMSQEVQSSVYEARLMYSPECFVYIDESTGRVYSGIIDPQKITSEILRQCIPLEGTANHALAVEIKTQKGEKVAYLTTSNWDMKPKEVKIN